jgi:hypothetical protein
MMKSGNPKSMLILISLMLVTSFGFGFSASQNENLPKERAAYTDVVSIADGFIAITNNGRIDWISDKGVVTQTKSFGGESFKSILANNQQLIILNSKGHLFFFDNDSSLHEIENQSKTAINCITLFKNRIIAGCDEGGLCVGNIENSLKSIQLDLKGNIVSLSAGINECWGVTDKGEIISSKDGINWIIFDFNSVYKGYYKACTFIKVETIPNQIVVVGKTEDGTPALFFSSKGNVWSERPLSYTNEKGFIDILKVSPKDIYYDFSMDQFIMIFNEGKLLTIPSCSHCQKMYEITNQNLNSISGNNGKILIVGENNYFNIIDVNEF